MRSIARDKILLSTPAQLALVRIDDSGFNQSGAPVQFSTHHCRTTSLYPHPNFALKSSQPQAALWGWTPLPKPRHAVAS